VLTECTHIARRLEQLAPRREDQIGVLFDLAYNRMPSPEELALLSAYAGRHGLANLCRLIVNSNEFLFLN